MTADTRSSGGWFAKLGSEKQLVTLLLTLAGLRGLLYATIVPALQLADEPDYFVDLQQFAHNLLPSLAPSPIGQPAGGQAGFHWLYLPVYLVSTRFSTYLQVMAVRFFSVALTVATIYVIYRMAKALAPDRPFVVFGAPMLAALIPQFTHVGSSVTPDVPATLGASAFLLFVVLLIKEGVSVGRVVGLVISAGVAILSKQTAFYVVPVAVLVPGAMILSRRPEGSAESRKRNIMLAGWVGSLAILAPLASFLSGKVTETTLNLDLAGEVLAPQFVVETFAQLSNPANPFFKSFWAHAGFLTVSLADPHYAVLVSLGIAAVAGLAIYFLRAVFAKGEVDRAQLVVAVLLVVAVILEVAIVLIRQRLVPPGFGGQGRWAFPAIAAIAVLAVLGWQQALGSRYRHGLVALVLNLVALDAIFLWGYVIKYYYTSFPGELNVGALNFGSKVTSDVGKKVAEMRLFFFTWRIFYVAVFAAYVGGIASWCRVVLQGQEEGEGTEIAAPVAATARSSMAVGRSAR